MLIRNGVTVFALARFVLREQNGTAVGLPEMPKRIYSSERHGCGATIEPIARMNLPVTRVCVFESFFSKPNHDDPY